MKAIKLDDNAILPEGCSVALGNFDGFHKGHARLLLEAKLHGQYSGALLISPSYDELFCQSKVLMGLDDKMRFLSSFGIDFAFLIESDEAFFGLDKQEFMSRYLDALHPNSLIVGEDYTFARKGEGTPSDLRSRYKVYVVRTLLEGDRKVSSTWIRECLREGDVKKAWSLLGHPYEVVGKSVHGRHLGTGIGFPTCNLRLSYDYLLPRQGVYAGIAYLLGKPYKAMINVGSNPTVGGEDDHVEIHLLDYDGGDAYGYTVYCDFLHFVRGERKFASLEDLKSQLERDKLTIYQLLQ